MSGFSLHTNALCIQDSFGTATYFDISRAVHRAELTGQKLPNLEFRETSTKLANTTLRHSLLLCYGVSESGTCLSTLLELSLYLPYQ